MYKAAVIGCGRIGSIFDQDNKRKNISTHCGAYTNHSLTELVAVCDLNKNLLDNSMHYWGVQKGYTDYCKMLKNEKIDILSICTYNNTHLDIIKKTVQSGVKAIFCEKPISDNLNDASKIMELCNKNDVLVAINHFRRNDELFKTIKKDIAEKVFGEIQHVNFYYTRGIGNSGSHLFDLLRFLFGDIKEIYSYKGILDYGKDPTISSINKFESDVSCHIIGLNGNDYRVFDLEIYGTKKVIKIDSAKNVTLFESKQSKRSSEFNELLKVKNTYNKNNSPYFLNSIDNIVASLIQREELNCSAFDGLKSLELIVATSLSYEENRVIHSPFNLPDNKKIESN